MRRDTASGLCPWFPTEPCPRDSAGPGASSTRTVRPGIRCAAERALGRSCRLRGGVEPNLSGSVPEAREEERVSPSDLPRVSSPVEQVNRGAGPGSGDPPLGRLAELRALARGRPQVSRLHALRPIGPRLEIPLGPGRRGTVRPSEEGHGGHGSPRARVDPPDRTRGSLDGMGPGSAGAMVETGTGCGENVSLRAGR